MGLKNIADEAAKRYGAETTLKVPVPPQTAPRTREVPKIVMTVTPPLHAYGGGFIFTCRRCGRAADDPVEGIRWLDTHNCPGAVTCPHCHGSGRGCGCFRCSNYCAVCHGSKRITLERAKQEAAR